MSDIESDEQEIWSEEEEDRILCLFCKTTFTTQEAFLKHAADVHQFDFLGKKRALGLDFYGTIRFVNYLRSEARTKSCGEILQALESATPALFSDQKFMQPTLQDDALLFADWDEDSEDDAEPAPQELNVQHFIKENALLRQQLVEARQGMARLSTLLLRDGVATSAAPKKEPESDEKKIDQAEIDIDYFGSYSTRRIHELMLRDSARTEAYRDAMYKNKDFFQGKVVLDIGCGTGILSMFAARAGARKVIGIDMAGIIDQARVIVKANGLSDTITLVRSKVEEAVIPVDQVDIIISEWMGYFLLYESMLPSVLYARDKWLAPGGRVFPSEATMFIAGAESDERNKYTEGFWNNVYGFDMRCLISKDEKHKGSDCEVIDIKTLITDTVKLVKFDIQTVQDKDLDFTSDFTLTATRDHELHLFVVWFDTLFDTPGHKGWTPINLSTGPAGPLPQNERTEDSKDRIGTHWKQMLFFLENTLDLKTGDQVIGTLKASRREDNIRAYNVSISYELVSASSPSSSSSPKRFVQGYAIE